MSALLSQHFTETVVGGGAIAGPFGGAGGPRRPTETVSRTRLDSRFADATGCVLRLLAPGGYGKSTIVARWVSGESRAVRWLDLERVDNDPIVLVDALERLLSDVTTGSLQTLPRSLHHGRQFADAFLPAFGALVRESHTPFVLVLDDVHLVDRAASAAVIDVLAENLPPSSTLILAGRAHHCGESIGGMRVSPGVIDVTLHDLAFDVTETDQLMSAYGLDLDLGSIAELQDLFEGWPAALRLAALVLRADDRPPRTSVSDLADAAFIVDYLRSEWAGRLPPDEMDFLTEAACLERFTGAMCDRILGRLGSGPLLRRMHRADMVVTSVDSRDEWYRMHPLLARWLAGELRGADIDRWRQIHVNAAAWFAADGDIDRAVAHAERSGDLDQYEALVADHGADYLNRGMDGTVRRWLAGFPSEFLRESATLSAISAVTALFAGDGTTALQWSQYLSRLVVLRHDGSGSVEAATLWSETLRAFLETRRASELVEPAARAYSNLPGGTWHAFACLTLGGVRFLAGDAGCVEVLEEGAFEAQLAGATLLRANCIAALAIIGDLQGDRDTLRSASQLTVDLLKTHCNHTSPSNALVTAMQALAEARDVRRESSVRLIAASRRHLAGYAPVAPWFNVLGRMALVRACLLIDDPATARELLREIDHHLRFEVDGSSVDGHVEQLRESVAAANKLLAERSWSLTAAELKVVHYLPSNLNLGDIATRLFVSRNTVKSHVSSIYRKLGTTSRSRAVELAREAGFLNDQARDLS